MPVFIIPKLECRCKDLFQFTVLRCLISCVQRYRVNILLKSIKSSMFDSHKIWSLRW